MQKICLAEFIFFLTVLIQQSATERTCPIMCECSPDYHTRPRSVQASCKWWELAKIPEFNTSVTYATIYSQTLNLHGYDFEEAGNLTKIELNSVTSLRIPRNTFRNLQRLEFLSIRSSRGSIEIDSEAFTMNATTTSLSTVILKGNLTEDPSYHFCEHKKLRILAIAENQISSLRLTKCVEGWMGFNRLNISYNPQLQSVSGSDFYHLRNLPFKELVMKGCGLTVLPSDLFQYTPMLEMLDFGQNNISGLPTGLFDNLTHLLSLSLSDTFLHGSPLHNSPNIIPNLQFLLLRGTQNTKISFGTQFRKALRMEQLDLGNTSIDLQESTVANLNATPLDRLSLRAIKLESFAQNALRPLRKLTIMRLADTALDTTILDCLFTGISDHLQKIYISNASLSKLEPKAFSSFSVSNDLRVLVLTRNGISTIEGKAFAPLKKLEFLDLSKNMIGGKSLKNNSFFGLLSLKSLILRENSLVVIPSQSHVGQLPSLKTLDLWRNNINLKDYSSLSKFYTGLSKLNLGRNSIGRVNKNVFKSLKKLNYLELSYNKIGIVDGGAFDMLPYLSLLGLEENQLYIALPGIFGSLSRLKTLYLESNTPLGNSNLSSILRGLTELQTVTLSRCDIKALPTMMFHTNSNLTNLELTSNSISSWEPSIFAPVKKLAKLLLGNNKITTLSPNSFKFLTSLQVLDLSNNPLACTCDLLWFKHWMNTVNIYSFNYPKNYVCASPPDMKDVLIMDFAMTPIECSSKTLFYILSGSGGFFIVFCVTLSVAFRYRWYIRYYMFLVSARRRQARDALLEEERYQYDAYVCYHHSSRYWVIKNLIPELEYKGGIKLCLHDRDWLVGPYILDNIVDSLDKSRKTLLIVNNGFLESAWCREETTLAYHRLVEEQRNLLVVVLLENIRLDNLDSTLRTILTSRTYLAWPTKMKRESKFWKALRRALGKSETFNGQVPLGRP